MSTSEPPTDPDDVRVADLDQQSRVYLTRGEQQTGLVSRRLLDERRRRAEGRAVTLAHAGGADVHEREVIRRGDTTLRTTSSAHVIEGGKP